MTSFKGQFRYTLDDKGRVNLPAKFRKAMNPEANDAVVVTRGFDNCLFVYPQDEWMKIENKLSDLSIFQQDNRRFVRVLIGNALDCVLDKQGRINIPQNLAEGVNIKKEVLILGILERIEIWDPGTYEASVEGFDFERTAENIMIF